MKNILKNKTILTMLMGILIALVSFVISVFIDSRMVFTIIFIINICVNFIVSGIVLMSKNNFIINFRLIMLYLLTTLFILIGDVMMISHQWDLNSYSNLMYIKNIELYLGLYSIYVLVMVLLGGYALIKYYVGNSKTKIRQDTTKQ